MPPGRRQLADGLVNETGRAGPRRRPATAVEAPGSTDIALRRRGRVRVLLDDKVLPGAGAPTAFTTGGIDRATHEVQAAVDDAASRRLAASAPVEFHLRQASRLFPSRGDR